MGEGPIQQTTGPQSPAQTQRLSPMLLQRYPVVDRDTLTMTRPWMQWMQTLGQTVLPLIQGVEQSDALSTLIGQDQGERQELETQGSRLLELEVTPGLDAAARAQGQALEDALLALEARSTVGHEAVESVLTVLLALLANLSPLVTRPLAAPPNIAAASAIGTLLAKYAAQNHTHGIDTGTATITGTGFTDPDPTGTLTWIAVPGRFAVVHLPELTGTSDATTFTLTGIPSQIQPATLVSSMGGVAITNNSVVANVGYIRVNAASGTWDLFPNANFGTWAAANTKALLRAPMLAYLLL